MKFEKRFLIRLLKIHMLFYTFLLAICIYWLVDSFSIKRDVISITLGGSGTTDYIVCWGGSGITDFDTIIYK